MSSTLPRHGVYRKHDDNIGLNIEEDEMPSLASLPNLLALKESDNEISENITNNQLSLFNNSNSNFNSTGNDSSKEYLNQSSHSYKGADSDRSSDVSDTEYVRFLHSVNKDNDTYEDMDTDDEDGEEDEYKPEDKEDDIDDDDDDDDDDGEDAEFKKVEIKEVEDLNIECWQTIIGEDNLPPPLPEYNHRDNLNETVSSNNLELNNSSDLIYTEINSGNKLTVDRNKGQSLISSVINQIFAGGRISDVNIDGMPIEALRKLVARQMSMASQLLLQILLQEEDRSSGAFTKSYQTLLELSNHRQKALKHLPLMQMNMQNVTSFQQSGKASSSGTTSAVLNESKQGGSDIVGRYITRASNVTSSMQRTSSVLDVPALTDMNELFGLVDKKRLEIHGNSNRSQSYVPTNDPNRLKKMDSVSKGIDDIIRTLNMRKWSCLIPTSTFPLAPEILKTDLSSLAGRAFFTPAEDDLLLRGIIRNNVNEIDNKTRWNLIKNGYVSSKEIEELSFRYYQMTSNCTDDTKFKKYLSLQEEKRKRGVKWTHEEDIAMLRGYQIYGAKWQLISIFFLPHRHHNDIKKRWNVLEQEAKTSNIIEDEEINSICSLGVTDKELPALVKLFLHFLKDTDRELVGGTAAINGIDSMTRTIPSPINSTQFDVKNENKNIVVTCKNSNPGGAGNENITNKILLPHSHDGSRIDIPATEFEQDVLDDDDDGSKHAQLKGVSGISHNKERSHNALPISKNLDDVLSPNSRKRRKENGSKISTISAVVPNKYQSPVKRTRGGSFDRGSSVAATSPVTRSKSPSTSLFNLVTKSVK